MSWDHRIASMAPRGWGGRVHRSSSKAVNKKKVEKRKLEETFPFVNVFSMFFGHIDR